MAIQCRQTISEKNSFFEDLSRSEPQAEFFDEEKDDCYQRYKPDMKGAKGLNWIFIVIIIFMALSMGATAAQYHQLHRRYIKEEEKLNKAESEQGHQRTVVVTHNSPDDDINNSWKNMQHQIDSIINNSTSSTSDSSANSSSNLNTTQESALIKQTKANAEQQIKDAQKNQEEKLETQIKEDESSIKKADEKLDKKYEKQIKTLENKLNQSKTDEKTEEKRVDVLKDEVKNIKKKMREIQKEEKNDQKNRGTSSDDSSRKTSASSFVNDSTSTTTSSDPYICAKNEGDTCKCFGTVYYGDKYKPSNEFLSSDTVLTFDQMIKYDYTKKDTQISGSVICMLAFIDANPSVSALSDTSQKQCYCKPGI